MQSMLSSTQQSLPDHYLWLRSDDLEEAKKLISVAYDRHRLLPLSDDNLGISLHYASLNSVSLSVIEYSADVSIDVGCSTGIYVLMPLRGSLEVICQDKTIECRPGSGVIVNTGVAFRKVLRGDYAQLVVRFDGEALKNSLASLGQLNATEPVRFESTSTLNRNTRKGASWIRTVQYVIEELRNADTDCPQQLIAKPLEELLIQTLIRSHSNNYLDVIAADSSDNVRPWYVKNAQQYMQDHYTDDLTANELAELVGVSVRSLQYGFKKSTGMTPTQYFKRLKLDKARDQLLNGFKNDGVTDIALQCGFRQLGRFARDYRGCFGESPSDTLRRAKSRQKDQSPQAEC
jgi:AraC-like DNA-binding protein